MQTRSLSCPSNRASYPLQGALRWCVLFGFHYTGLDKDKVAGRLAYNDIDLLVSKEKLYSSLLDACWSGSCRANLLWWMEGEGGFMNIAPLNRGAFGEQ